MRFRPQWMLVASLLPLLSSFTVTSLAQEDVSGEAPGTSPTQATQPVPQDVQQVILSNPVNPTAETERSPAEQAAVMKEILSLRQMFGSLFEGTEVEISVVGAADETDPADSSTPTFEAELKRAMASAPGQPFCPTTRKPLSHSRDQDGITHILRRMSRELDTQAMQFEDQRQYDHADRLRGLAQQVRVQARVFEQQSIAPTDHAWFNRPKPVGPATYPTTRATSTPWQVGTKPFPEPNPADD